MISADADFLNSGVLREEIIMANIIVNDDIFKYYFFFLEERMNIFWNRYNNKQPLTQDNILKFNKFTNVYRATDRVSQYLIKDVIYNENLNDIDDLDILLRIIVFKIFNRIDTWEYIEKKLGYITLKTFDVDTLSKILADRIKDTPIFSPAYMMTGSHQKYNLFSSKHEKWLRMVEKELLYEGKLKFIAEKASSLQEIYNTLRGCSFIGEFLAYQYTIDMNYSPVIDYDENSFVMAGIGAIRGIKKCFIRYTNTEDAIRYTQENLIKYQEKYGYHQFKNLFGREPTLIDLQNCFCETDKYLRVKVPDLKVGNVRIKQKFKSPKPDINYFFPPKWKINEFIKANNFTEEKKCSQLKQMELTLFW